ncbi:MAG: polysaccharide biosynthesis C-terminal domain-containing protein [Desulfosporosinus sp.]|nr:polysaccharide biosynthesis C-terminal domain-containing protein [Desulfosporosinus sp.]
MRAKNSFFNSLVLYMMVVIRVVAGFILIRLIISLYGSNINGLDASILSTLSYLDLVEGGVGSAILYHLYKPLAIGNRDDVNSVLTYTNIIYKKIGTLIILGIVVIAMVYPYLITSFADKVFVVELIFINGALTVSSYFFDGKYSILMAADQKLRYTTVANILETLVGKCLAIVLALYHQPFIMIKLCLILGMVIRIGIIYYFKAKHYSWVNIKGSKSDNLTTKKIIVNDSKDIFIQKLCSSIFATTDILLISIFCGVASASVYAVYNMVIAFLQQLMSPLVDAPLSSFGNIFTIDDKDHIRKVYNSYEHLIIIVTSIFTASYLILINPFIAFYTHGITDAAYLNSGLALSLAVLFLIRYYRYMSASILNVTGNFQKAKKYYFIETLVNIILSIALIKTIGMIGVVIASVIAVMTSGTFMVKYVNKVVLIQSLVPLMKKIFVNSSVVGLITIVLIYLRQLNQRYIMLIISNLSLLIFSIAAIIAINILFWPDTYLDLKRYLDVLIKLKERWSKKEPDSI